ncbi:hypothetical protein QBC35DRAFT_475817 [Podospora australis]|uniref:Uncharacterized protein n=1 Tax=Podospora australis TaxID=1536484 RepID=A0AAN7AHK4_9PEZI|nr:hypothetical protein QBC35DRAFT_475817 [Podospora australis]
MLAVSQSSGQPNMFNHHIHSSEGGATSIKAAVAAGLGSSMFLFRGLSTLTPRIFTQASLPSPTRASFHSKSTATTPTSATSSNGTDMGSCMSSEGGNSRPNSRGSGKKSARSSSTERLMSQHQQHHQNQHSQTTSTPSSSSWTTKINNLSGGPKPQYRLDLQCSNCLASNKTCHIAPDLRVSGTTLAWQDPSFKGLGQYDQPHDWRLEVDLCGWSRTRDAAIEIIRAHTSGKSATTTSKGTKSKGGKAFRVDDLLQELEECGVRYQSSLGRMRLPGDDEDNGKDGAYKPRRERLEMMEQRQPQFRQAWSRQ